MHLPLLDIIWAFPVMLLGIALGVALAIGGIKLGPITIAGRLAVDPDRSSSGSSTSRTSRDRSAARCSSLREKEFVEAARAQGAGPLRIMFSELLPNLASTILVFFPLIVANAILLEAALSFLGAGVQPPERRPGGP